ncbi:response regulator [Pseudemcibacter aquimaris]|uniref:response regulator n=1 Tax=Pseudemcibacter aquimaris TaxID=2857064 RepID=UPI00201229E4|nr:response regulator [Pseudemcibacter aquimaris]MCC3862168.1 response regulator [Pseudemcibacter aquimaris]WDU58921.1 response regulator [Pseudemcibacter aquimaris]
MNTETPHILVIDDHADIRDPLAQYLTKHGLRVSTAAGGVEMDAVLKTASIDLIVLDIMMPGEDGLSICRRIQETTKIPVILLTALTDETDRIVGLELGADDYVSKPFNPRELLARIKSVLRRTQLIPKNDQPTKGIATFAGWTFDLTKQEVINCDGVSIRLSSGEHTLLSTLIEHAGTVLNRDQLLDLTKGREAQLFDRSIDNQVSRLRQKIEIDPKNPEIITTKWGGGYVFSAELEWIEK